MNIKTTQLFLLNALFWLCAGVYVLVWQGIGSFGMYQMNAVLMIVNAIVSVGMYVLLENNFSRWFYPALLYLGISAVLCLLDELGVFDVTAFVFYCVFIVLLWKQRV